MKKTHFLTLGATMMTLLLAGTPMSFAQEDYKPNRKPNEPTREQLDTLDYSSILSQEGFRFAFVNNPDSDPDKLLLQIIAPTPIQGCAKIYPFEAKKNLSGKMLTIDVKFPHILPDYNNKNRYDCNRSTMIGTEIVLSHAELIEKGVNAIYLRTKFGVAAYKLKVTEHMIRMEPQNKTLETLEYWILPKNALVLSVPQYKGDLMEDHEQLQMLARVARARGLAPIESVVEGYTPAGREINRFYFVDTEGRLSETLQDSNDTTTIGELYTTEEYYGPDGKYDKEITLDILAMKPGLYN